MISLFDSLLPSGQSLNSWEWYTSPPLLDITLCSSYRKLAVPGRQDTVPCPLVFPCYSLSLECSSFLVLTNKHLLPLPAPAQTSPALWGLFWLLQARLPQAWPHSTCTNLHTSTLHWRWRFTLLECEFQGCLIYFWTLNLKEQCLVQSRSSVDAYWTSEKNQIPKLVRIVCKVRVNRLSWDFRTFPIYEVNKLNI